MLEEIIEDRFEITPAENQPIFRLDIDYEDIIRRRMAAISEWKSLSPREREGYKNEEEYIKNKGIPDSKGQDVVFSKNTFLLKKEISEKIKSTNILKLLPIDSLDFDDSVLELAESLENNHEIKEIYKLRKLTTGNAKSSGINNEESLKLRNCLSQGRELYIAGMRGSLMVKPLNFFYALTAYSYGIIVLNNPIVYRKDMIPGSHGMSYLPDTIQAQFGGDSPRGTFSELVGAFPTQVIKNQNIEFNIDCSESIISFHKNRMKASLGTLLSMIPEMSDYYKLTTGRSSRCYPLSISNANDPRNLSWEFHIGDGEIKPNISSIETSFKGFLISDRHGKTIVTVPASQSHFIKACIYTDIKGNLWYVDNPFFPFIPPETTIHFLITNIYSSIMRYRPDEWGNVLSNEVPPSISLMTRHYFSSFQRKFFVSVLRSVSRFIPYAA